MKVVNYSNIVIGLYVKYGLNMHNSQEFKNYVDPTITLGQSDRIAFLYSLAYEAKDELQGVLTDEFGLGAHVIQLIEKEMSNIDKVLDNHYLAKLYLAKAFIHEFFVPPNVLFWKKYAESKKLSNQDLTNIAVNSFEHLRLAGVALFNDVVTEVAKEQTYLGTIIQSERMKFFSYIFENSISGSRPDLNGAYLFEDSLDDPKLFNIMAKQLVDSIVLT